MRRFIAEIFRLLFKLSFFNKRFYGIHKHLFHRYRMFRGVFAYKKLRSGIRMRLDLDDWIPQHLFFLGGYEQEEINVLNTFLAGGSVFIDVGANIGLFSLHASRQVGEGGRVIAFEPYSKNFDALKSNISLNRFANITAERLAVSNMTEPIQISCDEKEANTGMVSAYLTEFSGSETVYALTLDSYLKNHGIERVDFIKIDIEGGEYAALEGMEETIKKDHPPLLIEMDDEILTRTPYSRNDILSFLHKHGYTEKSMNLSPGNHCFVQVFST